MSKRVYITLNPNKEKDLIILDYLNSTYNEAETIKSILYKIATKRSNQDNFDNIIQSNININEELNGANKLKEEKNLKYNKDLNSNIEVDEEIKNLFA